ncbi:hypothetical protein BKA69DRAFT_1120747 [Paraphysoderma sedebokerense]|nr:hypothetical protein BKA69DRAFT_1120747 [Paraphysoderma sedebokerense]
MQIEIIRTVPAFPELAMHPALFVSLNILCVDVPMTMPQLIPGVNSSDCPNTFWGYTELQTFFREYKNTDSSEAGSLRSRDLDEALSNSPFAFLIPGAGETPENRPLITGCIHIYFPIQPAILPSSFFYCGAPTKNTQSNIYSKIDEGTCNLGFYPRRECFWSPNSIWSDGIKERAVVIGCFNGNGTTANDKPGTGLRSWGCRGPSGVVAACNVPNGAPRGADSTGQVAPTPTGSITASNPVASDTSLSGIIIGFVISGVAVVFLLGLFITHRIRKQRNLPSKQRKDIESPPTFFSPSKPTSNETVSPDLSVPSFPSDTPKQTVVTSMRNSALLQQISLPLDREGSSYAELLASRDSYSNQIESHLIEILSTSTLLSSNMASGAHFSPIIQALSHHLLPPSNDEPEISTVEQGPSGMTSERETPPQLLSSSVPDVDILKYLLLHHTFSILHKNVFEFLDRHEMLDLLKYDYIAPNHPSVDVSKLSKKQCYELIFETLSFPFKTQLSSDTHSQIASPSHPGMIEPNLAIILQPCVTWNVEQLSSFFTSHLSLPVSQNLTQSIIDIINTSIRHFFHVKSFHPLIQFVDVKSLTQSEFDEEYHDRLNPEEIIVDDAGSRNGEKGLVLFGVVGGLTVWDEHEVDGVKHCFKIECATKSQVWVF